MLPTLALGTSTNTSRLGLALLVVLVVLAGPLAGPTTSAAVASVAATAGPTPARSTATLTLESDAMRAINRARAGSGCPTLKVNTALRVSARRHSARMARQGTLSHRLAGEATMGRRVADAGYTGATMLGEVIALGPTTGAAAVRMWLASSMHRSILLNCRYRDFGAGVVRGGNGRYWWTVDLGRR
ncbi:MAG TPA: CAP domain-containing protein [Nocardioides sp.]|nr:CAP domain-containing protein [Nocardioides sp.]